MLIDVQPFPEPGIARDEPAARILFILPFLLEKASERGFEFGCRIQLAVRREKKPGVIGKALSFGTKPFIVDKNVPVVVFRQALLFCGLQQAIEIAAVCR
jgi:hypothetical protein